MRFQAGLLFARSGSYRHAGACHHSTVAAPHLRANISGNALKVLYRLHERGYQAFLVGGACAICCSGGAQGLRRRHRRPPEDVRKLFRNCRLIGRASASPRALRQ
jgi:hypothetical protein